MFTQRLKNFLALLLAVGLLMGCLPLTASAGGVDSGLDETPDNLTWTISGNTLTISGTGRMRDYKSTDETRWQGKRESITTIVVEEGVTSIGIHAFMSAHNVKNVRLPSTLKTIGRHGLWSCISLESISLPEGLETIGPMVFDSCRNLTSVTLPTSLKTIDDGAFTHCPKLWDNSELVIPEGVAKIGQEAFAGNSFTKVHLPASLASVDEDVSFYEYCSAFNECSKLESIEISESNTHYKTENGVLFSKDGTKLMCYPLAKPETSYTIPASVTHILNDDEHTLLSDVTLSDNIEQISVEAGNTAYKAVDNIVYTLDMAKMIYCPVNRSGTLTVPAAVNHISTDFSKHHKITAFAVENGNTSYFVEDGILYKTAGEYTASHIVRCPESKQGEVTIPDSIVDISFGNAFKNCSKIETLNLSKNCEIILNGVTCSDLSRVLQDCTSLTAVNVSPDHAKCKSVKGVVYSKDGTTLLYCPLGKTELSIEDGTTMVENDAFPYFKTDPDSESSEIRCPLKYIVIPSSVTEIKALVYGNSEQKVIIYGERNSAAETYATGNGVLLFRAGLPEDYVLEPDWTKVTAKASVSYGTTNAGMVTIPATGTATDGETTVSGKFEVLNASAVQGVGSHTVTVQFTVTSAGDYKDMTFTKDYTVEVTKKPVTVKADNKTKVYGEANPILTLTIPNGALVGGDTANDLGVTLTCAATTTSPAGTPVDITGTSTSANYDVTVTKGTLTITKAAITGYQTAAPTATILANSPNNTAANLKTAANLPANVTVTYKDGTASLPITWADATEKFNAKGGAYTFKGTVTPSTNFNAYNTPLTATLTVTPVTGTLAMALPASVVVAQSQAASAASYADFKLPSSITINCNNGVAAQTITPEWSVPLNTLKSKRAGSKTTVKVTNVPAWLTMDELSVEVQVTDKFPVNVTVTQANGTYGTELAAPVASQTADGNGTDPSGTFTYKYTGTTAAGKTYNSNEKPTEAGSYTVTATLVSDTHAGSGSANFTIAPKALANSMIGAIDPVTYTGSAQTPALTVTDGKTLVKDTDYTVEYTNNTNAGTATATITGKGNYTGTASTSFTIHSKDISGLTVTITGTPEVDQALLATVSGAETSGLTYAWTADGGAVAGQTKPYLILTSAYENKQIAATVTGSGNYTGTASSQAVTVSASTNESTSVAVPAKPEVSANVGNRLISVNVTVPTEETDKPVCLYEIQLCDSTGTLIGTYYSLTNSYTITDLSNGTAYQVKAIAYNVNGASAQSDAATATPKAPAPIGGGGSSTPTTPDPVITENPDGSTTTTETADDGTVTAITTWDDGQQAVAVKSPEGEKTITVTTATGEKVADVNIPATPAAGKEFEDVKSGSWYESAVDTATGYGLFNGTSETKFSPDDGMTRAMLATVLHNLSGNPDYGTDTGIFEDVEAGKWYEDPVDWAYKVGVTSGTSETEFSPNKNITREQLVTMLYRYAEKIGAASSNRNAITDFPDGNKVAGFAKDAMQWAVAEGFISGRANGGKNYIAPQGTATRAEVAAVLTKFVEYLKK